VPAAGASALLPAVLVRRGRRVRAARRAHILAKKVSPRAFVEQPGKKGQATGEVGIEGTTIEAPDAARATAHTSTWRWESLTGCSGDSVRGRERWAQAGGLSRCGGLCSNPVWLAHGLQGAVSDLPA